MVYWISVEDMWFPDVDEADEYGRVAVGGDLSIERLILAYSSGIFPWYSEEEPIIWYSPDPRFILSTSQVKISKSMRPYFNKRKYTVSYNTCFEEVIQHCSSIVRDGQIDTWITNDMIAAYVSLHQKGLLPIGSQL